MSLISTFFSLQLMLIILLPLPFVPLFITIMIIAGRWGYRGQRAGELELKSNLQQKPALLEYVINKWLAL